MAQDFDDDEWRVLEFAHELGDVDAQDDGLQLHLRDVSDPSSSRLGFWLSCGEAMGRFGQLWSCGVGRPGWWCYECSGSWTVNTAGPQHIF